MAVFGPPPMLTQEQAVEIRVLARQGVGIRAMARQLGCSRNTVKRYLRDAEAVRYGPRAARATKLDRFKPYLRSRVEAARPRWIPAVVLLREIRERGYEGGLTQLKLFLAPLKAASPEPVVRFETAPGEQMQADFTVVRRGRDPLLAFAKLRRVLKDGGLVLVEGEVKAGDDISADFHHENVHCHPSNWWIPTIPCLRQWVLSSRFEIVREYPSGFTASHGRHLLLARAIRGDDPHYWGFDEDLHEFQFAS